MIVHINHIAPRKQKGAPSGQAESDLGALVTGCMMSMVEEGILDPQLAPSLRIHLDWIHYKENFRDPVIVRRTTDSRGRILPLAEIAVDLRQADAATLEYDLVKAVRSLSPNHGDAAGAHADAVGRALSGPPGADCHVRLGGFTPYRECLMWGFNRLFWQHLAEWEAASGKGFEKALPSGSSDANHPQAVADSARKFWTLLTELERKAQAPSEIIGLEIGVGTGARAAQWLDRFKEFDAAGGTRFYDRIQFILGDFSPTSLQRALKAVAHHGSHVRGVALDALNPLKALTAYRFKVMYVHSTNTYDNLPFDDIVRRDGRLYLMEVRAYLTELKVRRLQQDFGFTREDLPGVVERLLEEGPAALFPGVKGVECWRRIWEAFKLEERLRALDDYEEDHVPPGLNRTHLEDLLAEAPDDVRFHISRGAGESFANTLPLLHPRGFLEVQDIFVSDMNDYRKGFRGPGKLDGSLVTWVNGALLRAVGARAGYDVHFAPFPYRPGSHTTVLYTTQRD